MTSRCGVLIFLLTFVPRVQAQAEPPRFAPPRPIFDGGQDLEDPSEDDFDLNDNPNRVPPPPVGGQSAPQPPQNDFAPAPATPGSKEEAKLHFKIVEGQFYEKGKPRGRAPIATKKTRQSSMNDNG